MEKKKKVLVWSLILLGCISGLIVFNWELYKMPFGHELMYLPVLISILAIYTTDKKLGAYFVIFLIVFFLSLIHI